MPERKTLQRARRQRRRGKAASTQAGEFVREEMHHVRSGKHGAKNRKQAIAIGLSKARRSGVKVRQKRGASRRSGRGKGGGRTSGGRARGRTTHARARRRSSRRR